MSIIIAMFIGAFIGIMLMCILQINRVNDYEKEIAMLKEKIK